MRALKGTSRRSTLILFLIVSALQSCSVGDYLEAYFNTYYNAQRLFSEAEEEIRAQQVAKQIDTTFLPPYNLQGTTKQKLTSVVEKSSKLLQYHEESSLVDDALMMIGKSYYYQNELQRAERKFGELVAAYPETDLGREARLLLAQTYYRMNQKDRALTVALSLADSSGGDDPAVSSRAFVVLGHIHAESGNLARAHQAFVFAAEQASTAAERTSAHMQVGAIAARESRIEEAYEAYGEARRESPEYISEYRAVMGQVEMLRRMEEYGDALDLLESTRDNSNFREFNAHTDLELANVLRDKGDIEEAIAQYQYVDTTYARTEESAQSHYRLGLLYENLKGDYTAALATYGAGKGQAPQSAVTALLVRRYNGLSRYKGFANEIARLESLKTVVLAPPSADTAVVDTTADTGAGDSVAANKKLTPLPSLDSLNSALARNKAELGALFYGTLDRLDSARFWYTNLLVNHEQSPYCPRALYTLAQISSLDTTESRATSDSLYREIVRQYPESEFADEARRFLGLPPRERKPDPADRLYARGEYWLEQDSLDSAIAVFDSVLQEYPASPLAPKAQYAIGWIYEESRSMPDSAVAHYQQLVARYPGTVYATRVMPKLSEARNRQRDVVPPAPGNKKEKGPAEGKRPPETAAPGAPPDSVSIIPPPQQMEDDSTRNEEELMSDPDPE